MALSYSPEEWGEEKPVDSEMQKYLDSVKPEFENKTGIPTTTLKGESYRRNKKYPRLIRTKVWAVNIGPFNITISVSDTGEVKLMDIQEAITT